MILLTVSVTLPVKPFTRNTGAIGTPDADTVAMLPTVAFARVVTVNKTSFNGVEPPRTFPRITYTLPTT